MSIVMYRAGRERHLAEQAEHIAGLKAFLQSTGQPAAASEPLDMVLV